MKHSKGEFIRIIIISLIISSSIIFIIGSNIQNGKILVIQNNTTGVKSELYLPDEGFSLGYTHSVMKTPAEEFFVVDENNEIILEKTIYESYGVGLPFLSNLGDEGDEGVFEIKDDKFILYINRTFSEINMIISPIPEHYIKIGNTKYDLMDMLKEPDCSITIYAYDKKIIKNFFNISSSIILNN